MMWGEFLVSNLWALVTMVILLMLSAFFSGTETALFQLSRGQLYRLTATGAKGRLVGRLMSQPQRVLSTILMGNLIVNVAYSAEAAAIIFQLEDEGLAGWAVLVASLVPLLVLILLGEVTPKVLATSIGERWSVLAAPVIAFLMRILRPLLWVLEKGIIAPSTTIIAPRRAGEKDINADELAALLDISAKRGLIDHDVNAMLQEIVELSQVRVEEIMIPRVEVVGFDINQPREKLLELFSQTHLRKLPVYDDDIDNLLGIIHARSVLLNPNADLKSVIRKVSFVPESAALDKVLMQFRVARKQIAMVVDEYGGIAGLITLEDIVEEIVGEISESGEIERGPAVQKLSRTEYLVDGGLSIREWSEAFGRDLTDERISTIGGFVMFLLGRMPKVGDTVGYHNLRFIVLSVRRRRIDKVRIELVEAQP
ncbi:MAG: hemolysin family protein [Phycisphaerae bacterium]